MDKNSWVTIINLRLAVIVAALALFITGTFIACDWINYIYGSQMIYPAFAKPAVSGMCALIAFGAWGKYFEKKDYLFVVAAFVCIVIVDITMSIFVYGSNETLTSTAFLIGAILSIVAHGLLVVRHSRGFNFLKPQFAGKQRSLAYRLFFPLAFYLPVILIFVILSPALMKVNQFWPSLVYALILTTSLWISWETVRQQLFPRMNAILIALGVTSWFITELVGVVHNIEIGTISDICMNLTWHFYMPAILLLAFSVYHWKERV